MLPRIQGSGLRCAAEKRTVEMITAITSPTRGWRNQAPTFCMIQPRKKYSSAAAWNGVMTNVMINKASHWAGRGELGRSTKIATPM